MPAYRIYWLDQDNHVTRRIASSPGQADLGGNRPAHWTRSQAGQKEEPPLPLREGVGGGAVTPARHPPIHLPQGTGVRSIPTRVTGGCRSARRMARSRAAVSNQ